jgi:hypothetical protein
MSKDVNDFLEILKAVECEGYEFEVKVDGRGEMFVHGSYIEPDISTGLPSTQYTRRWFVSPHMTKSEFVQTLLKCVITSREHRTREHFKYKGHRVYSPHFNVDALMQLCMEKQYDYRTYDPEAG